jgi:hypothetical protein
MIKGIAKESQKRMYAILLLPRSFVLEMVSNPRNKTMKRRNRQSSHKRTGGGKTL